MLIAACVTCAPVGCSAWLGDGSSEQSALIEVSPSVVPEFPLDRQSAVPIGEYLGDELIKLPKFGKVMQGALVADVQTRGNLSDGQLLASLEQQKNFVFWLWAVGGVLLCLLLAKPLYRELRVLKLRVRLAYVRFKLRKALVTLDGLRRVVGCGNSGNKGASHGGVGGKAEGIGVLDDAENVPDGIGQDGHIGFRLEKAGESPNDQKLSDRDPEARVGAKRREAKARHVLGFMAGAPAVTEPVELRAALR